MHIGRRQLLSGIAASAFVPYLPRAARAFEPLTALQAGAAVVGIISGIAGIQSDSEFKARLAEINAKLDQIVRLQVAILEELQSLKLFITEALVRDRKDATANALNAQKDRFDILVVSRVTPETIPLYNILSSNVEQSAFEISRFDFSAYISFSTGVAIDLAIYRQLSVDKERLAALRSKVYKVYDNWLDAQNSQSVTNLIGVVENEINAARGRLDAKARTMNLRTYDKSDGPKRYCTWTSVLTVQGDFASGYAASVTEVKGACESLGDICTRTRPCFTNFDIQPLNMTAASIPTPIPENSGYQLVDEFNRERNQVINQMLRLQNLVEVRAQIEALRDTFK